MRCSVRVTACELLPASMHTPVVVKMKVSFHMRSVIRVVTVLQTCTQFLFISLIPGTGTHSSCYLGSSDAPQLRARLYLFEVKKTNRIFSVH